MVELLQFINAHPHYAQLLFFCVCWHLVVGAFK